MHRNIYAGLVVVPLLLAFCLLLFSAQTEYWTYLDFSKIKAIKQIDSDKYQVKKVKFEFPKYTSLFGECDEFKSIDILLPKHNFIQSPSLNYKPSEEMGEEQYPMGVNDDHRKGCISQTDCFEANEIEPFSCFCCGMENQTMDTCCFMKSNLCDGVPNCIDKSDEFKNCPIRKLYYATRYVDNKHRCLRHQYNLITFIGKVMGRNFTDENDANSEFCLKNLLKSNNYTVKIFVLRMLTLLAVSVCVVLTLFCFLSIIFVSCCHDLPYKSESNGHLASEENFEISPARSSRKCCRCNCLLCPFLFHSIFSFLALLSCLTAMCIYLYSLCYVQNVYLVYDPEFIPEHISQAYQYNSWLFDIQRFGVSFYTFLSSFFLYLLVFITSICISCRIQLSPEWKNRHINSYEVLQMHDIVLNSKKISKENKANEKEAKKIGKKYKKKEKSDDGFSFSEESNALNMPKTRLAAMDDSYE
ncbi:hypothetical protein BpHYR1_042120 [Brachionus plicatilis]|uniref:Uncharacterized protein n=1 Tax=Brachionus plicatilis TaxID=10195 RepID=A0A3M7R2Z5_BRAPC|nr:hypothetical protein BpHYR1_042120 [Brachionus plicatilis]